VVEALGAGDWVQSRLWRVIGAGILAGLVASAGHAPFGLYPLGFLGLMLGFWLVAKARTARRAVVSGWALGTGYFAGTLSWIVQPFLVDVARYGWMAPFAISFLAGGLALFWALASGLAYRLSPGRNLWLIWAALMGLGELIRGGTFTGFPWGGPALFWVDTPLIALAGFIGASGMGALTFAFAAAGVAALCASRKSLELARVGGAAALLGVIGVFIGAQDMPERANPVRVRLIQPNAPQHLKWHPDFVLSFLERAIDLTGQPAESPPDLVIWPETSVPYLLQRAAPVLAEIAGQAAPAKVVLGIQRQEDGRYYNSLVALDEAGVPSAVYDKHHLVPFGEYTPAGGLLHRFGIRGFAAQYGYGYSPGPGPQIIDLGPAGKALPLICYEAIFPGSILGAPERPGWLLQATNDAWFGTYSGPQQHLQQARLRAAEFGLPMVRAANTGISAVIDARGRVVAQLGLNQAGFLDADLPAALPVTFYAQFGEWPLILLLIGIIALLSVRRAKSSFDHTRRAR